MSGWVLHAVAALVGLGLPALAAASAQQRSSEPLATDDKVRLLQTNAISLWVMASAVVAVWCWQGGTLGALGWTIGSVPLTALVLVLLAVGVIVVDTVLQTGTPDARRRTSARWRRDTPFMPENRTELGAYAWLSLSAAVCEETVFRGFLIRYLEGLFGDAALAVPLAVALPAIAFGVAHGYQGAWRATKIIAFGALFGTLFVLTSSLLLPIMLHLMTDLVMGVLGTRILAESPTDVQTGTTSEPV